ncbi:5-formaminoimidazole-4-carboxamide-1-(beta)-D-ribofuranosyl 5'-monophosphate synthetase [uncultured archaeon]|nr:5-formaminoimidazole-4-carboxamide-1-(beta)-D-ribofuranosyl 5'-monophosphate synthetase [uncultured archaeon]
MAGTNIYPLGSPYTPYLYEEPMSMGRRIAREIKTGAKLNKLNKIIY